MRSLVYIAVLVAVIFSMFKAEIGPTISRAAKDTKDIWKNVFSYTNQTISQEKLNSLASGSQIEKMGEGRACKFADVVKIKINDKVHEGYHIGAEPIDILIAGMKQGESRSVISEGSRVVIELIEIQKEALKSKDLEKIKIFDNILTYSRILRPKDNVDCHMNISDFEGKRLYKGDMKIEVGSFKKPVMEYLLFGKPIDSLRSVISDAKDFKDLIGNYKGMILIEITTKLDA